jgi:hypothetical protein
VLPHSAALLILDEPPDQADAVKVVFDVQPSHLFAANSLPRLLQHLKQAMPGLNKTPSIRCNPPCERRNSCISENISGWRWPYG